MSVSLPGAKTDTAGGSGEEGAHAVLRAPDDRPVAPDDDGPLEQARLRHQQLDQRLRLDVVRRVQPELRELRVLPHQVGDGVLEPRDDLLERRPVGLLLQVLDDVELDAQLLGDLQSSLGRVSVRVVEDRHLGHGR
jgi:hypothetical protein